MAVRKVTVTLPEELYELVERARTAEHRTRSEVIQDALRTHFGEATYVPTEQERRQLLAGRDDVRSDRAELRDWSEARALLRRRE